MKVAVIGPGAMGLLYGAKLSKVADVVLIGNNAEHISQINENSVTIKREGKGEVYDVKAVVSGEAAEAADPAKKSPKNETANKAYKDAGLLK
ncbi:MAG: hypothetical protein IKR56_10370 [Lachnospiraceae bacterium]|nr:hypothetical protein [Lachnospiraceae bacterium]